MAAAALALCYSTEENEDPFDVLLVTDNVKDLAKTQMAALSVRVMNSGAFLNEVFNAEPDATERAIDRAINDLKAPPYTLEELLFALREQGARVMVDAIASKRGVTPRRKLRRPREP